MAGQLEQINRGFVSPGDLVGKAVPPGRPPQESAPAAFLVGLNHGISLRPRLYSEAYSLSRRRDSIAIKPQYCPIDGVHLRLMTKKQVETLENSLLNWPEIPIT